MPARSAPARTTKPHRSVGHRYGAACATTNAGELLAVGVRFDDDDPGYGASLVLRLRPGRVEAVAAVEGVARAIALAGRVAHVLCTDGRLWRVDGDHATAHDDGLVDLVPHGDDAVVLDDAGGVRSLATARRLGRVPGGRALASDGARVVVATPDAVVDASGVVAVRAGGACVAVAGERVVVADDTAVHDVTSTAQRPRAQRTALPHPAHAVALFAGQAFIGSRTGGLFVVDDDGVRALRPSLRARALHVSCGHLVVISDLLLGVTDDGIDFLARDLAGYVRLADKLG